MPTDKIEMLWFCGTCNHRNLGRDMKCSACGKPKEDEEYVMPDDVSHAAAVTDPELLRKANAGPNWTCTFCGCDQRRLDGSCAQCGAGQDRSEKPPRDRTPPEIREAAARIATIASDAPVYRPRQRAREKREFLVPGVIAGVAILVCALLVWALIPRKVEATVSAHAWTYTAHVDRWQPDYHEGWRDDEPSGAFDVVDLGTRVHHYEKVFDHNEIEPYTASVECGQDCRTVPGKCYTTPRHCTPDKNGFATCTGGDRVCDDDRRVCEPKYCDVKKTRTVAVYRDEPRYEMWCGWRVWEWQHNRDVSESGTDNTPHWPSTEKVGLNSQLPIEGEKERESDEARYEVTFTDAKGKTYEFSPQTLQEFQSFAPGSRHTLRVSALGGVEVLK